jgi:hypothetical protein
MEGQRSRMANAMPLPVVHVHGNERGNWFCAGTANTPPSVLKLKMTENLVE